MNAIDDYVKNGGPFGYIRLLLDRELAIAAADPKHPLHPVVEVLHRGAKVKATRLLISALRNVDESHQQSLKQLATFIEIYLVRLPALAAKLKKGDAIFSLLNDQADLADAVTLIEQQEDAEKHRASIAGARNAGNKTAQSTRKLDSKDREIIAASLISVKALSVRFGVSESYIRRLRRKRNIGG
jgi:hypothetical protein